jgi:acyl carrier protein
MGMADDKLNIINILSKILNMDHKVLLDLNEDESLRDYGLNSIRGIELIIRIEQEYGINIGDNDLIINSYDTINKIQDLVKKYKCIGIKI